MQIKTLAAMKRAIATPGVRIHVVEHWRPELVGTVRTPKRVQTQAYTFMSTDRQGNPVESWADYPKYGQMEFHDDGTVTWFPGTKHCWRLRFELAEEVGR